MLVLLKRFNDALELLSADEPKTLGDWIGYHIRAMIALGSGETQEAARLLQYGLDHSPWYGTRPYYASALAVVHLMQRRFEEVLVLFDEVTPNEEGIKKQARTLFATHAHAELKHESEARQTIHTISRAYDPGIVDLQNALERRYDLNGYEYPPTQEEIAVLDETIREREFYFALLV